MTWDRDEEAAALRAEIARMRREHDDAIAALQRARDDEAERAKYASDAIKLGAVVGAANGEAAATKAMRGEPVN